MSSYAFELVMLAAVLHALWNAIVKAGQDTFLTTVLVTTCAALWAALALPFLPLPRPESWPFIAASALLQVLYYALVARIYRLADMSQTYPLMRGVAPLLVALIGTFVLGEHLTSGAWLGIGVICLGILLTLAGACAQRRGGLGLALLTALLIATYTLVDGAGVRLSHSPIAYTLWIFLLGGLAIAGWAGFTRGRRLLRYARGNWHLGAIGGFGTLAAYALALQAMTLAPVSMVAALRESSILFATLIAWWVLKEPVGRARWVAVGVILAGVVVLRLA
jgi:drug/metabolite transporter (DMT)-like permease